MVPDDVSVAAELGGGSIQSDKATCKNPRNLIVSKKCLNFMACVRGVVFHLPWVMIHNIKSTDLGSYHVEGFQDWCMYSRNNHMLEIATWDEKPCSMSLLN